MKKLFAILLAVTLFASMATVVSAANTTTLTTTVPAASYTLNIPADQDIAYGATSVNIGEVKITNSSNFAVGKNVSVTITYDAFTSADTTSAIPFSVKMVNSEEDSYSKEVASGDRIVFKGSSNGTVNQYTTDTFRTVNTTSGQTKANLENCNISIASTDWGKALTGEYTATITFTAEVVAE